MLKANGYSSKIVLVIECPYCGHEDYYNDFDTEELDIGSMVRLCRNRKCRKEFEVASKQGRR